MVETTPRLALPLLTPGQAQKEMAHNEALARLDMLAQASVVSVGEVTPPTDPADGACWIIGANPGGAWAGRADYVAGWSNGGWRFVAPRAGMHVWSETDQLMARYREGGWEVGTVRAATLEIAGNAMLNVPVGAIATPSGGATIDEQARMAISAIISALQHHGLIATT